MAIDPALPGLPEVVHGPHVQQVQVEPLADYVVASLGLWDYLLRIFALSVVFVFLVLAALYESWSLPTAIICERRFSFVVPNSAVTRILPVSRSLIWRSRE